MAHKENNTEVYGQLKAALQVGWGGVGQTGGRCILAASASAAAVYTAAWAAGQGCWVSGADACSGAEA